MVFTLDELIALSDALQPVIERRLNYYDGSLAGEQTLFFLIQARLKIHTRMVAITAKGKSKGSLSLYLVEYRTLHSYVINAAPAPMHTYNYLLDARAKIDKIVVNYSL